MATLDRGESHGVVTILLLVMHQGPYTALGEQKNVFMKVYELHYIQLFIIF